MDSPEEARQYDEMDHTDVNNRFINDLISNGETGPHVIDLGCGTAAIPILLCHRVEEIQVMAIDSAISMLQYAKIQIDFAGLLDRVQLEHGDAKNIRQFPQSTADTVISNSLLHHLPDPAAAIDAAIYLCRDGGRIFIRDLARPATNEDVQRLVQTYTGNETDFAKQLFRQSLHAALTLDEIQSIAGGFGISADHVQMTSDRHWTIDWVNKDR